MPTSSSRLSYPDCEQFFDKALEDEVGARLCFQTEGHARQFLVRANTFRKICRQDNKQIHRLDPENPMYGRCEYDPITLTIVPTEDKSEWFVYGRRNVIGDGMLESLAEVEGQANAS